MSNHRDQAISTTHPEDGTGELSLTSAFQMDSSNNNIKWHTEGQLTIR